MNEQLISISKFLSYVLRHHPEAIGLTLDSQGWVDLDLLIKQANQHGQSLNRKIVMKVVETNDKKRFTLTANGTKIRAAQGHSTKQVKITYPPKIPPEFLYHGTATRFINSIKSQGLLAGTRQYVHLSKDSKTAIAVGKRHGQPIVLKVRALAMSHQGFSFYQADNGVWLTPSVPTSFIEFS